MSKVLVVGGGGREHALTDVLVRSPSAPDVLVAPGNVGTEAIATNVAIPASDVDALVELAVNEKIDLVVVGPEAPLVAGLADRLRERDVLVLGPSASAAQIEGSKAFAKTLMVEAGVPTAKWGLFADAEGAIAFARDLDGKVAVKADGLAGGKGVIVCDDVPSAESAIRELLGGKVGAAGKELVVEEKLEGEELSVLALSDGEHVALLAPAQDHKRARDGDLGPNTGGMGAYSPAPRGTPELMADAEARCIRPIVETMKKRGTPFSGVLYAGLMLTEDGPKVLEYNVRFGDPEAQVILPRIEEDVFLLLRSVAAGTLDDRPVACSDRAALTVVLAAENYPATPVKGDAISGLENASARSDVRVYHAGTRRDGDTIVTHGGRVLAVTGMGDDLSNAARTAYDAAKQIGWRGQHRRNDIGYRALGRSPGLE